MQIDGHHALTYIAARFAGFPPTKASVIAYSAQYVDDAVDTNIIRFNKYSAMYHHIASAHKMVDHRNLDKYENHLVWIPFHFLPGNEGKTSDENFGGNFEKKLICKQDSYVARDMLKVCVKDRDKKYALYRLGVTMHVYADTFAHQGFAGINNKINKVKKLKGNGIKKTPLNVFPLGHGPALTLPDAPFLNWEYTDSSGIRHVRNNPETFIDAANMMCKAMRCHRDADFEVNLENMEGIPEADLEKISLLLKSLTDESGDKRHEQWLKEIQKGTFSFGSEQVTYIPEGKDSWHDKAIGKSFIVKINNMNKRRYRYRKTFITSHWKLFHDALQAHQFDIIHDILPKYGICAA